MTDLRGRGFADLVAGLNAGQHLAMDAMVAFVDGELGPAAHERAAMHLTGCQSCAAEVEAQRDARRMVRSAQCPPAPADLLAALRDIPHTAGLPHVPAGLAVTAEGTLVALADPGPTRAGPMGTRQRGDAESSTLGRWIGR
jgi:anti-sigma factor RsiW